MTAVVGQPVSGFVAVPDESGLGIKEDGSLKLARMHVFMRGGLDLCGCACIGADVKTVQARLRHASAKTTLDTYGHIWPDRDESTRAVVDAVLTAYRTEQRRNSVTSDPETAGQRPVSVRRRSRARTRG